MKGKRGAYIDEHGFIICRLNQTPGCRVSQANPDGIAMGFRSQVTNKNTPHKRSTTKFVIQQGTIMMSMPPNDIGIHAYSTDVFSNSIYNE